MVRRKTTKEYIEECKQLGYDFPIEEYINTKTKIKHKCNKCGNIYIKTPDKHLQGQGCPNCALISSSTKQKKTSKAYYNECKERGLDLPIEPYVNNHTKIKHRCNKCGNIYEQIPNSHLQGRSCPVCSFSISSKKQRKNNDKYIKECKQKEYDLPVEQYINARTKIKHRCSKGHIYKQTPDSHLRGSGCPYCSKKKKKTSQSYFNECNINNYDLPIESYRNNKTKIKHRCTKCGYIYVQSPKDHLKGKGCPICNQSHGERFIQTYLDKHNILYIPQKKFKNLKDKRLLSYDFYLPKKNILIEYQGEQHYTLGRGFLNKAGRLEKQQLHDKLKREYAKNNGYKLLELHYSLDNQELVDKYLSRRIKD